MEILKLIITGVRLYSDGIFSLVFQPFVWIALIIAYTQYSKAADTQRIMYGNKVKYPVKDLFATSLLFGILAGFFGTIVMTVVGVTFGSFNGLQYIIFLSILLMLINPRYVCLSYSGGILSLIVLITGDLIGKGILDKNNSISGFINTNFNFEVSTLMAIIAVMHLIEAALMWIDGHRGAVPVFMKRGEKLVGAFIMQKVWLIPIMFFVLYTGSFTGETTPTPDWWPLIRPNMAPELLKNAVFTAMALPALLGYGDFAVSTDPVKKVRRSAKGLFVFSMILFILAIISNKYYAFKYIAALFAPLAHEGLILFERYRENSGKPLMEHSEEGIIVVDTVPGTPSDSMGFSPGDVILSINNIKVNSIEDIENIFKEHLTYIWAEVKNPGNEVRTLEFGNFSTPIDKLGVITVPRSDYGIPVMIEREGSLERIIRKLFKRP